MTIKELESEMGMTTTKQGTTPPSRVPGIIEVTSDTKKDDLKTSAIPQFFAIVTQSQTGMSGVLTDSRVLRRVLIMNAHASRVVWSRRAHDSTDISGE